MKIKVWERIAMAAYALLGMAASLLLGWVAVVDANGRVEGWVSIVCALVVLLLLAWSVKMLMLAFRHVPKVDKSSVSVQNTENGSVRISVQAMETLVRQAIGQDDGVVEIKTAIVNHEDSITVNIDMTLTSDVHIPNLTMLMQRTVKNFIEEYSGIAVREVTVMVSSIVEVAQPQLALEDGKPVEEIDEPEALLQQEETSDELGKVPMESDAEPEDASDAEPLKSTETDNESDEVAEGMPEDAQPEAEVCVARPEDSSEEEIVHEGEVMDESPERQNFEERNV